MEIQFLGAAQEVTGSCFLMTVGGRKILVDCGLIQGNSADEARNRDLFLFDPQKIDAVILTHAHLDHSGRLPLLVKRGFTGPIYTHPATRDLCRIMLLDAAYLSVRDAEWENRHLKKNEKPVTPLYTREDVECALQHFTPTQYNEKKSIFPTISFMLSDAGHILGSSIVELWVKHESVQRKLVFSGDLGHKGASIVCDPAIIQKADLVVMESTYGDRDHRPWDATWQELADVIQTARRGKGNIIIPAFAVGRTQELLYVFKKNFYQWGLNDWQMFLDSPMAIETTKVYSSYENLYDREAYKFLQEEGDLYTLPNLYLSETSEESMKINTIRSGAIIIAGSGMCTGGRIRHHLKYNLWRKGCHVIFIGFQAKGTLGRSLVDGAKSVTLWGETINVHAKVHTIGGLSAHADKNGLLDWYGSFANQPPVVLIHGELSAAEGLREHIKERFRTKALIPKQNLRFDLQKMLPL